VGVRERCGKAHLGTDDNQLGSLMIDESTYMTDLILCCSISSPSIEAENSCSSKSQQYKLPSAHLHVFGSPGRLRIDVKRQPDLVLCLMRSLNPFRKALDAMTDVSVDGGISCSLSNRVLGDGSNIVFDSGGFSIFLSTSSSGSSSR